MGLYEKAQGIDAFGQTHPCFAHFLFRLTVLFSISLQVFDAEPDAWRGFMSISDYSTKKRHAPDGACLVRS